MDTPQSSTPRMEDFLFARSIRDRPDIVSFARQLETELNQANVKIKEGFDESFSKGVSFGKLEACKYTPEERERYGLVVAQYNEYTELLKTILAQSSVIRQKDEALKSILDEAYSTHGWGTYIPIVVRQYLSSKLSLTNPDENFQRWLEFVKEAITSNMLSADTLQEVTSLLQSIGETI